MAFFMESDISSIKIKSMRRIMLKLSGEILVGSHQYGLDPDKLLDIAEDICNVYKENKQVCIVVGGGNIFRGISGASPRDRQSYCRWYGNACNSNKCISATKCNREK